MEHGVEIILGAQTFINSGTTGLGQPATPGEATWHHRHASTTSLWAQPGGEPGTDFAVVSSSTQLDTAMRVRDALVQPRGFYRVAIELP